LNRIDFQSGVFFNLNLDVVNNKLAKKAICLRVVVIADLSKL